MRNKIIVVFLLSSLIGPVSMADELTTAKYNDLKLLIKVSGGANATSQFMSETLKLVFQTIKASNPAIPDRALVVMEREVTEVMQERISAPGGMMDQLILVYDKYLTHQEIRELLAFHQSPIGKKINLLQPKLSSEGMMVGRRWGESLLPEIDKRMTAALKREGLLPKRK